MWVMNDDLLIEDDDDPAPIMSAESCRYPNIVVQLTGNDGGTGAIMANVIAHLEAAEVPSAEISEFRSNILFVGDYNDVLRYVMSWVSVR